MKRLLLVFINATKPFVRRLAEAYDIRLNHPGAPRGRHPVIFADPPDVWRHHVPKSVYFNTASGPIRVGHGTSFGEDVQLLTGKHMNAAEARAAGVEFHHVPEGGRDITIGAGCFIGSGAIIIGPSTIGDYAVVAAGAIVVGDVPEGAVVAGAKAQIVRTIDVSTRD